MIKLRIDQKILKFLKTINFSFFIIFLIISCFFWIVTKFSNNYKFKNDFYIDSNKILCDINKECISIDDKCIKSSELDKKNLTDDVSKILDSFQAKYNLSVEEIKGKVNNNYDYSKKYLKNDF